MKQPMRVITLALPPELIHQIDAVAKANYLSRASYIRRAVVRSLNGGKRA